MPTGSHVWGCEGSAFGERCVGKPGSGASESLGEEDHFSEVEGNLSALFGMFASHRLV